jgi:hypothetical protein
MKPDLERRQLALRIVQSKSHVGVVVRHLADPAGDGGKARFLGCKAAVVTADDFKEVARRAHDQRMRRPR